MVCKLADFVVELKNLPPEVKENFSDFMVDSKPQVSLEINEYDIEYEINIVGGNCTRENAILIAYLRKFAFWMVNNNAFLFHASLIDIGGTGVAFCAPSGTGKTTHTLLWQEFLGDRMTIINGDKPIIRIFEDKKHPIGYGTAWNGKERLGNKGNAEIKHICFIERAETNSCEKVESVKVLNLLFKQVFFLGDSLLTAKILKLLNLFLKNVTVWKIKCNMDIEAAKIAYNTIFEVI